MILQVKLLLWFKKLDFRFHRISRDPYGNKNGGSFILMLDCFLLMNLLVSGIEKKDSCNETLPFVKEKLGILEIQNINIVQRNFRLP